MAMDGPWESELLRAPSPWQEEWSQILLGSLPIQPFYDPKCSASSNPPSLKHHESTSDAKGFEGKSELEAHQLQTMGCVVVIANTHCRVDSLPHLCVQPLQPTQQAGRGLLSPGAAQHQLRSLGKHPTPSLLLQLCLPAACGDVPLLPLLPGHGPGCSHHLPAPHI